jgi:two-component system, NarL family, sensor histidine kinase UhpB
MTFQFSSASASMRLRLILIPPCFLLLGIIVAIGVMLYDARDRIALETASGVTIGTHLIEYALDDVAAAHDPEAALARLQAELAHVRHIRVAYQTDGGTPKAVKQREGKEAPAWFLSWFEPEYIARRFPVVIADKPHGELIMWTKPSDEAAEVWEELVFLIGLLSIISAGIVTLIWLSASQTLKPLRELVEGLDRLQCGQFDAVADMRVAELRRVGEHFNMLAQSLARTEADKRLLIDRLMSIQESERKELARELHDEFGASLFGIRAAASCIIDAASSAKEGCVSEIIERAKAVSSLADTIQKHNYRILERIRPITLSQMGLYNALHHLVDEWRTAHSGFDCKLVMPDGQPHFNEAISLTSYRIVQECLTNVARHSKAKQVDIVIDCKRAACFSAHLEENVSISVADDGVGLPRDFRFGFGFLGMNERVRNLGGYLKISNAEQAGARIEAIIPVTRAELARAS